MKAGIKLFLALVFSSILFSCKKHSLNTIDYVRYVEEKDNGLLKTSDAGDLLFKFQYKPYEYLMVHERSLDTDDSFKAKRLEQLKGTAWFNISIISKDKSRSPLRFGVRSKEEYDARYSYFLSQAAKDIVLLYGQDTLHPLSYQFETSYNLAPQEIIVVGFAIPNDSAPQKDMQLTFFDRVFGNGIIKASFEEKDLKTLPQLIF